VPVFVEQNRLPSIAPHSLLYAVAPTMSIVVAQWERDTVNVVRDEARWGLTEGLAKGKFERQEGDEIFEQTDAWPFLSTGGTRSSIFILANRTTWV
jgi:hypothetical protein